MRTTPAHRPIQLTRTIFTDINTNTTHSPLQANTNCSELRGWAGTRGRGVEGVVEEGWLQVTNTSTIMMKFT